MSEPDPKAEPTTKLTCCSNFAYKQSLITNQDISIQRIVEYIS